MILNVWLALRDDAQTAVKTALKWNAEKDGPYTGPVSAAQHKLFRRMYDLDGTQRLFKTDVIGGRTWTLWSVYFDSAVDPLNRIRDLLLTVPATQLRIIGAWWWDSRQIGTQWVSEIGGEVKGTPAYPFDARMIKFMPSGALEQVNKLLGQEDRRFG